MNTRVPDSRPFRIAVLSPLLLPSTLLAVFKGDRHGGHQDFGRTAPGLEIDVGGHADLQFLLRVDEVQLHFKGGDAVFFRGAGGNLTHRCLEALIGIGIHPDLGGLAGLDAADVAFWNAGPHLQALRELNDRGAGGTGCGRGGCGGGHKRPRFGVARCDRS